MSHSGKVALVAGAGGGMGLAIANDLISAGTHVTLADIKPRPDDIREGPGTAAYVRGGAMVHISSIDALSGDPLPQDGYGTAKAGVIRLSKSIVVQFAKDGIRSNAILPGPVLSPMQARWQDNETAQRAVAESIPLGRLGTPQDIANACLFLLSDGASFVTGTELIVDGGCTAMP